MNHGLFAPQFGLGRISPSDTPAAEGRGARSAMPSPGSSATGPTVIFKRRRLLEGSETVLDDAAIASTHHKAPKVYRLTSIAPTATTEAEVQSTSFASDGPAEGATEVASPVLQKPRRRRDPTRQPTLLRHVVIEPPAEAYSTESAAEQRDDKRGDSIAVRGSLKQLDAVLEEVARAQEAFRALDEHLRALGIPSSAA
jgi:hypothetical protein